MPTFYILSLDGGGIRGVLTAILLDRIETASPGFLAKVDLFAGTSTGGILALGLASGLKPQAIADLYAQRGSEIFDKSWIRNVREIGGLIGADYDNKKLKAIMTETFGKKKLRDLGKERVLIPAFQLDNRQKDRAKRTWKAKFFHNFPGSDSDGDESIVDVAMRTSAAPTYFPTYQGYIDGGVVANNPCMAAVAQALDRRSKRAEQAKKLDEIVVLSVGTGTVLSFVAGKVHDWGVAQWGRPLINLMLDGNPGVASFECEQLLGDRYFRLAPTLPPKLSIKLDDAARVGEMVRFARSRDRDVEIREATLWLQKHWV